MTTTLTIERAPLSGVLKLPAGHEGTIELSHCYSDGFFAVDLGGSGVSLDVRGFTGRIALLNKHGDDPCTVDINAGWVEVSRSVSGGLVGLRGIGSCIDSSGPGAVVDATQLCGAAYTQGAA